MKDIEKRIDELDKDTKQKAENTLKVISDNYRDRVSQRIAFELSQAEACRKVGDDIGAKHHEILAEVFKSLNEIKAGTTATIIVLVANAFLFPQPLQRFV